MSDEDERYAPDLTGPLDSAAQIPIAALLDDPQRRSILLGSVWEPIIREDAETGEEKIIGYRDKHPVVSAIIAAGLTTQNNLLHLSARQAQAKKIEYNVLTWLGGLPYRRNKDIRVALEAANFSFSNTVDGMASEGTFSLLLTKLTGSIKEIITGERK